MKIKYLIVKIVDMKKIRNAQIESKMLRNSLLLFDESILVVLLMPVLKSKFNMTGANFLLYVKEFIF
ncbi:hypothetical protein [Klebsiella pneumoniae]|uniref:hypothetical protein n=1 Tax=Klebsiella pneumoniae TaxID=573 RepID=UPI0015E83ECC|nr:hypothetical protein [Klebsiella pneumoniae]